MINLNLLTVDLFKIDIPLQLFEETNGNKFSGKTEITIDGIVTPVFWERTQYVLKLRISEKIYHFEYSHQLNENEERVWNLRMFPTEAEYLGVKVSRDTALLKSTQLKQSGPYRVKSQMPGKIIKTLVKDGDTITKGDSLLIMEAMKMENELKATVSGVVQSLSVQPGQTVESGYVMLTIIQS